MDLSLIFWVKEIAAGFSMLATCYYLLATSPLGVFSLNERGDYFCLAVGYFSVAGFNDWFEGCVAVFFEELAAQGIGGII